MSRHLIHKYAPQGKPGFLGRGHIARPVIQTAYSESDPFILLMDDMLDKKDEEPAGGPHPHAGFETVTLMLEGELGVGSHKMQAGDLQMMTAGSGIIHTETIESRTKMRLLQLWLVLPKKHRWTIPRVQDMKAANVPIYQNADAKVKVYSGTLLGISSPLKNYVPVIIADVNIHAGRSITLDVPGTYTTFLYMLRGTIQVGESLLSEDEVGWLERTAHMNNPFQLTATTDARCILYAGQPQGDEIVSHGPFIADTQDDIRRLYHEYNRGQMQHISTVGEDQLFQW